MQHDLRQCSHCTADRAASWLCQHREGSRVVWSLSQTDKFERLALCLGPRLVQCPGGGI